VEKTLFSGSAEEIAKLGASARSGERERKRNGFRAARSAESETLSRLHLARIGVNSHSHTSHTLKGDVKQGFNLVYDLPKWATSKLPAVTFLRWKCEMRIRDV
jgi:hypothetical protein